MKLYYDDGSLQTEMAHCDGLKHGITEWWHRNGTLMSRIEYNNGKQHGLYEEWDGAGTLRCRMMCKSDTTHGLLELWDKNGRQTTKVIHVNGKQFMNLFEHEYDDDYIFEMQLTHGFSI